MELDDYIFPKFIIAKGSELSNEIKKDMARVWRSAFNLSSDSFLSFPSDDIFCVCGKESTFQVYSFLQARKIGYDTEIFNFCSDPVFEGNRLGTDTLDYFLTNFESVTFSLSVVLIKDFSDSSFQWDNDILKRLKLYSKFGFLIKDVKIDNKIASLVLIRVSSDSIDYTNENYILFKNLTSVVGSFENKSGRNYVIISFPQVSQLQDFVNLLSKNSTNPNLFNKLIVSCDVKLFIKHKQSEAARFLFYWIDYINKNPDTIITPILNTVPPNIFFLNNFNSQFEEIVFDILANYPLTKVIVPLSISKDEYFKAVDFLTRLNMQYKLDSSYSTCVNFNFDFLLFERNPDWPVLSEDTANLIYDRHLSKFEGDFNVEYEITKSELQFLQTLLNKDIEYGGSFRPIKVANTNFLVNSGQIVKGTEHEVYPPPEEVNFHVHPKYCNSKYKFLVSWPSGPDFRAISRLSSGISPFKIHMLISEHGIYFIKVSRPFRELLTSLSENCKEALFIIIFAYFMGLEQLRKVENIDKILFLKDLPSEDKIKLKAELQNQLNNPDVCFLNFSNLIYSLGQSFIEKVNQMRFGDLLKVEEFVFATDEEDKKRFIKSQIEVFYKEIMKYSACPTLIDKAIKDNFPLFIVKFADWKTLLSGQSFKFS